MANDLGQATRRQSLRVLFPFVGDTVGGSHKSAALLIRELSSLGVDAVVLIHRGGPLAQFLGDHGISSQILMSLPVWERKAGAISSLVQLIAITPKLWIKLRRLDIDIVHVNDGRMAISWCLACRLAGVPLVIHQRTRFAPSRVSALALRLAERVLAISRFTQESLPISVHERSRIVLNPFDGAGALNRKTVRAEVVTELGLDAARPLVVFVGTLQKQKRPRVALQTLAMLRDVGVDAVLLMVGRSSDAAAREVDALIHEFDLAGRVRVLGFRWDAQRMIAAADVLLAPAVDEGHGRAVVEAMLVGTPVAAAASGGHLEAIEHGQTGVLVPPDDPSAFAEAIVAILANADRSDAMARTAHSEISRRHDTTLHARAVVLAYRESIGRVAVVIESMGGGGAQQVVGQLLTSWVERGDSPVLITFQSAETDRVPVPENIERHVIGGSGQSHGFWHAIVGNVRRLLCLRCAIRGARVRTAVSFVTATNVLTILAALGLGVRVVVSERNDPVRQSVGRVWTLLRRLIYPLAWRVTANSRAALLAMAHYIPSHRLALVPNPLRPDEGAPTSCESAPFVLAVGRLHSQKNYPVLLKAFAKADLKGWRLRILGEGAERHYIKTLANELGVAEWLDLPGHVADPYPHYRAARIFVMTSSYEGSPNALWEAMSMGLPAIISDSIVGALELVEVDRHVVVVPAGDVNAVAMALKSLAGDMERRLRIGREAALVTRKLSSREVLKIWDAAILDRKTNR